MLYKDFKLFSTIVGKYGRAMHVIYPCPYQDGPFTWNDLHNMHYINMLG